MRLFQRWRVGRLHNGVMVKWTESIACFQRVHCVACRQDAEWRKSLQRASLVEDADFKCPFNVSTETAQFEQDMAMAKLLNQPKSEYDALKAEERRRRQLIGGCCGKVSEE